MIEDSVKKVEEGNRFTTETAAVLEEIHESVNKVTDLVGSIAACSNEQAQGISQINSGLLMIDQAVQQNSANVEETSAAAHELSSQAS